MPEVLNEDERHLNLLVIFHYVVAGLVALFSCFFIIHLVIGIIAIVSPQVMKGSNGSLPPPFFGWLFALIGGFAILLGWAFAICLIIAGRFLARRKRYLFCMVMAAMSCMCMPFGTILGIFTIIVLQRPSVKEQFKQRALTT